MIVVYPMLVSKAVSEISLPGIGKMLEDYLIKYHMNEVLADLQKQRRVNFKIKAGKIFMKELDIFDVSGELLSEITPAEIGARVGNKTGQAKENELTDIADEMEVEAEKLRDQLRRINNALDTLKASGERRRAEQAKREVEAKLQQLQQARAALDQQRAKFDQEKSKYQAQQKLDAATEKERKAKEALRDFEKEQEKAKKSKFSVSASGDVKSVSLEPTTFRVRNQLGDEILIGVKVVPIRVRSDAKLSYLILGDLRMGTIRTIFTKLGRGILRTVTAIFLKKSSTPIGDPRKDVLMARTGMRGEAFIVLDKHHDVDESLVSNPKAINKLFGLKWGNIIITDDIKKTASFCMKKFKGMCNIISYQMMYQSIGQAQAYADMEEIRKKSGTLFKYKKSFSKIVSEIKVEHKLTDYYFLREDQKDGKDI